MNIDDEQSRVFLQDSLELDDLLNDGATFEIKTDFEDPNPTFLDELNHGSDDEDEILNIDTLLSPWTQPFDDLKKDMVAVNECIYKRIIRPGKADKETVPEKARVHLRYSAYWEHETIPFDSSALRGAKFCFYTGNNEVLEGLENAVRTMKVKEEAQFIISYKLLFGELGCPPRIRPKADGLFVIELMAFDEVGDLNGIDNVAAEDRNKYSKIIDELKKIHLKGSDFFKHGDYKNAARSFEKAADCLNFCELANEQEQQEQEEFLLRLHTNLTICYNNLNQPCKTCIVMKSIRRLTNNRPSCKALFNEGRALHMLGEYDKSRAVLKQALRMNPSDKKINNELKLLDQKYTKYNHDVKNMWAKAFGAVENKSKNSNEDKVSNDFEDTMEQLMKNFKEDLNLKEFDLPSGLTPQEVDAIDDLAKRMQLKLRVMHGDETYYSLAKID